jgi:hypothetical protein
MQNVRGAAKVACRQTLRVAGLLARDGIVARRYEGTFGSGRGGPPLHLRLLYVGREAFAREFERYFDEGSPHEVTLFRGGLPSFILHKKAIAREAADADMTVCEDFPGGLVHEDDVRHYPMLEAHLKVEESLEAQIRRVRSRTERRLMREVFRRGALLSWIDSSREAYARFQSTLYTPYVHRRFGEGGVIDASQHQEHLYARSGRILFVASRDRPSEPLCGALLLDWPGGELAYRHNGFAPGVEASASRLAEATAGLELALMKYAMAQGFTSVAFGYTRAFLDDGVLTHKRRLGCSFVPLQGSPRFRLHVQSGRRAEIFARFPLLARTAGWTALLGFDESMPSPTKRGWRAVLKNYRIPDLDRAIVWTKSAAGRSPGGALAGGALAFRSAVDEVLELPGGVEFRTDR